MVNLLPVSLIPVPLIPVVHLEYLVADATLFDFILVSYSTLVYEYIRHIHYFAWGLHCGCIFKMSVNCSHKGMFKTGFKIYLFAEFGK